MHSTFQKALTNIKAGQRFFSGHFLDLFSRIFVRAFLNVDLILFYYLLKNLINDFQLRISSTYQYIAKFRSKCPKPPKKHSVLLCHSVNKQDVPGFGGAETSFCL